MISKHGLDVLLNDYRTAANLMDKAAATLEYASVSISSAGPEFTRISSKLINDVNDVCAAIGSAYNKLNEVTPDED
ncbi:hypothetical protein [Amycolatopsis rubida]|uniref:Excreted virulence factor EspC, type VII ESX diderm n=1 Tax=Amycolatopsis rubida TaxID=112413 RepID=A0A1I5EFZ2_9PSEU|nr:hypothetical protein [Amycolatopsis rubida]SFO10001.1 hypothetical protein SAMN05421854_101616 [Amycolatopsis rubida]